VDPVATPTSPANDGAFEHQPDVDPERLEDSK
jgi:hypothetical protein